MLAGSSGFLVSLDLWGCGKVLGFPIFPQASLFLIKRKEPNKLTLTDGAGGESASQHRNELPLRHFIHTSLAIIKKMRRAYEEKALS